MKIADIRRVIESARWSRNDLSGATQGEFRNMDVSARMTRHIVAMHALIIPPRFVLDIADRDDEVTRCRAVIQRWVDAHNAAVAA